MVKVDSDGTTMHNSCWFTMVFFIVFLLRIPLACGTGLLTRSQAPEEEGAPLKGFQKWHANGANGQNHISKIWSNTMRGWMMVFESCQVVVMKESVILFGRNWSKSLCLGWSIGHAAGSDFKHGEDVRFFLDMGVLFDNYLTISFKEYAY